MTPLQSPRRIRRSMPRANPLYGLFYPANCLRILALTGDPGDGTCAFLTFDRDVRYVPTNLDLWVDGRCANNPELVNPRKCRIRFAYPITEGNAWTYDPAAGAIVSVDGCAPPIASHGVLHDVTGSVPAGKIYLASIAWIGDATLDFAFSTQITVSSGDPSGFFVLDHGNNPVYGNSAQQVDTTVVRVGFNGTVPINGTAGLLAGFAGVDESGNVISPVTARY